MKTAIFCFFMINIFARHTFAQDPIIEKAMRDELERSMKELKIENLERPYFISYFISDQTKITITASMGAIVFSLVEKIRPFDVDVRVGSYEFDNSNIGSSLSSFKATTLEANYHAIRRDLWEETDRKYKIALGELAKKKALLENQVRKDPVPDFSRVDPTIYRAPPFELKSNKSVLEKMSKELSAVFRRFPKIRDGRVAIEILNTEDYFVNSEGSIVIQPFQIMRISAYASVQAEDGMILSDSVSFLARDFSDFPQITVMMSNIEDMCNRLITISNAPYLEDYAGPVLFLEYGAGALIGNILAKALGSRRESDVAITFGTSESLQSRIGSRVMPRDITVYDDPKAEKIENQRLFGNYKYDVQGVEGQKVTLIERGILRTLLTSRTPERGLLTSNGHARGSSGEPMISNLFVESSSGVALSDLKSRLITEVKDRGLTYGIIIKRFDADERNPLEIYKVFLDGKEEIARGVQLKDFNISSFKDIIGVSKERYVYHSSSSHNLKITYSIVTPSLLFEDVVLKKRQGPFAKPIVVPPPP